MANRKFGGLAGWDCMLAIIVNASLESRSSRLKVCVKHSRLKDLLWTVISPNIKHQPKYISQAFLATGIKTSYQAIIYKQSSQCIFQKLKEKRHFHLYSV